MALWVNMIAFMLIAAGVFYILGFNSPAVETVGDLVGVDTSNGNVQGNGNLWFGIIALLSIGAIVVGTAFFPNPYVLFAGIAGLFLSLVPVFSQFASVALAGAPTPVLVFLAFIFTGTGLMAVLAFLKGGE